MRFTKKEIATIKAFYGKVTSETLGQVLNKSVNSIRYQIKKMQKERTLPFLKNRQNPPLATISSIATKDLRLPIVKQCTTCKRIKSLDEFHVKSSSKDGRRAMCKSCRKERRLGVNCGKVVTSLKESDVVSQPKIILIQKTPAPAIPTPTAPVASSTPTVIPPVLESRGTLKYTPEERTSERVAKKALAKILMNPHISDEAINELKKGCDDNELRAFISTIQIIR